MASPVELSSAEKLRNYYIGKQQEIEAPYRTLAFLASAVTTVAIVILGNISSLLGAALIAVGIVLFANSVILPWTLHRVDQTNRQAADALIAPGFYEFGLLNATRLSSASAINSAFNTDFLNGVRPIRA